jgi:hypothetical protein
METVENKNFKKKSKFNVRSYFNSKIRHAIDTTNMHCQGVDKSYFIFFKKGGGGLA